MKHPPVYLDYAATTPVRPEVVEAMLPFFGAQSFGNPSSAHRFGRAARAGLEEAKRKVAAAVDAEPNQVVFTSGGTEADNLAIVGAALAARDAGRRMCAVVTAIEHKAILAAAHAVCHLGGEEIVLPVTGDGVVELDALDRAIAGRPAVVSVMWVNNEIGVIQPIEALAARSKEQGALFHTDAVQAFGKVAIDLNTLPIDLLTISGHKIGAPKGIGALFVRRGVKLDPLMHGGDQDRGRRPGTENVAFAVGLARAAELAVEEREAEVRRLAELRDRLETALLERIPDAIVHGRGAPCAPHILNISVAGTDSESMLMALDLQGVACSAGSACQSGSVTPSHVLRAMGVRSDIATSAIRMSLGSLTNDDGITRVAELFPALIQKARRLAGQA